MGDKNQGDVGGVKTSKEGDNTPKENSSSVLKTIQSVNIHQSSKIDVVKFDGSGNFGMWRCEVKDALNAQNLEDTLEFESKPADLDDAVWKKMNRSACGVIRSCLTQDLKYDVMDETSARKIWEMLAEKYLTKSVENRLHLKRRLYRFQLKRGTSKSSHMVEYTKLLADLASVDEQIGDEDKALILLSSLPDEEYETFVMTLINGKSSLSYSEVKSALVNLELRRKDKEASSSTSAEVLTVRGKKSGDGKLKLKSKSGRFDVEKDQCAFCKQHGHWKSNCAELQKKMKQKGNQPLEVNIAKSTDMEDSDSSAYSLSICPKVDYSDMSEWMLDSGATYHVCPRRDCFSSFEELDSGMVYMADGHACQILGIGTINIKMFDGRIRELTGVRYVPALRKNLISLGVLAAEGLKVCIEDRILKVVKGSLIVMKGVGRRNLYYLRGSTVTEHPATSVVDSTRLWQLRLGHTGVESLHTLAEQGLLEGAVL